MHDHTLVWCQFRYYIDPPAQIDTKKKITRLPPF